MLDRPLRRALAPSLDATARWLARRGVRPAALTVAGLVLGVGAGVAAALSAWTLALGLWLLSRLLDGLDGPVARVVRQASDRGAWADMASDVLAYAAIIVGAAIGQPDARLAAVVLLAVYYVNGSLFVLQALAVERSGGNAPAAPEEIIETDTPEVTATAAQERSRQALHSQRGLVEGTETIVATSVLLVFPEAMVVIMGVFAGLVGMTAVQRALATSRLLAPPSWRE